MRIFQQKIGIEYSMKMEYDFGEVKNELNGEEDEGDG